MFEYRAFSSNDKIVYDTLDNPSVSDLKINRKFKEIFKEIYIPLIALL